MTYLVYHNALYKQANQTLLQQLNALRPKLSAAAQKVVDDWQQDEEGIDEIYGSGGVCDEVARELQSVLSEHGIDSMEGGQPGDDHAWLIAYSEATQEAVGVDIPPNVYETGGGYSWKKRQDVEVDPEDVVLFEMDFEDIKEVVETEDW